MYYAPTAKLNPIDGMTWHFAVSAWDMCTDEYKHRTDMEWLDARQMFEIADKAPSFDCLDSEFYNELANKTGVALGDDLNDFMCSVENAMEADT